jgi:hypothetical protein
VSKREVWVLECAERGKGNWYPMAGESFKDELIAKRNLQDFAEPPRELWEYRLTKYVPEKP